MEVTCLYKADERIDAEFRKIAQELGEGWAIVRTAPLQFIPGKNYTAKGGAQLRFRGGHQIDVASVLFSPGDNTGTGSWVPRKKEGEAELYMALGTKLDGKWAAGLTSLMCSSFSGSEEIRAYKHLTTERDEFKQRLWTPRDPSPRRFDFTFDRKENYGDPHLVGFPTSLAMDARPLGINYQVGAFALFPEPCEELDILREIVKKDKSLVKG